MSSVPPSEDGANEPGQDVPYDAPSRPLMERLTRVIRRTGEPWTLHRAARYIILINRIIKAFTKILKPWEHICKTCQKLELHQNKFIVSHHSSDPRDQAYSLLLSPSQSPHSTASTSATGLNRYALGTLGSIASNVRCPFCKLVVRSLEESNLSGALDRDIAKCAGDIVALKKDLEECFARIEESKFEIERCNDAIRGCTNHVAGDDVPARVAQSEKYRSLLTAFEEQLRNLEARAKELQVTTENGEDDLTRKRQHRAELYRAKCHASFQMDGREVTRDAMGEVVNSRPRTRRIQLTWSDQRLLPSYIVLVAPESGAGYNPDQLHSWESSTSFLARSIGVAKQNDARIKQWVDLCQGHHGKLCNRLPGTNFNRMISKAFFGVIDVGEMRLAALPPGARYVALSYTWGKPNMYTTTLKNIRLHQESGGLDRVWLRLPRVIRDAIQLVRSIGERYLWVDSLCIVQKNTVSWDLNSSVMDLVYGNAYVTICAAEGEGANIGLVALEPRRQVSQYIEECAEGLRLTVSHLAETYIEKSRWSTRGWTFQERLLSRRCIIFAGSRVFFQCRATAFSEDVNGEHESVGWSIELVRAPLQMLVNINTTAFSIFMECIRLYTTRKLGESKDILAAFQGMSNLFGQEMGAPLHFGLPTSHFDIALLWEPISACVRRPSEGKEGKVFGGLVFPSWSWAGWDESPIHYHKDAIAGCLANVSQWLAEYTWIHWYIRDGQGDLRPVWTATQSSKRQHITWSQSRWLGYGWYEGDASDGYGRIVKREYLFDGDKHLVKDVFSRTLPEYPFGIGQAPSTADSRVGFPDQPFLQFWTWAAYLRVLPRTAADSPSSESASVTGGSSSDDVENKLVRCDIQDYCGDWCGTIVLNAPWFEDYSNKHPDQHSVHEFLAVSEAKGFSEEESHMWTYYVPCERENADWELFYVLLVTRTGGICYRQGLGKVFKEAFAKSYLPGKEWKEIIMG